MLRHRICLRLSALILSSWHAGSGLKSSRWRCVLSRCRRFRSFVQFMTLMQLLCRHTADGCETNERTWLIALQLLTMPCLPKGNGRRGPPSSAEQAFIKLQFVFISARNQFAVHVFTDVSVLFALKCLADSFGPTMRIMVL